MLRPLLFLIIWATNIIFVGEWFTILLTLPIFILCLLNLSIIKNKYITLSDMFWFVYFLFFVISPIQSISKNYFLDPSPARNIRFTDDEIITAILIPTIFALILTISTIVYKQSKKIKKDTKYENIRSIKFSYVTVLFIFILIIISLVGHVILSGGLVNMLSARYDRDLEAVSALGALFLGSQTALTLILVSLLNRKKSFVFISIVFSAMCLLAIPLNVLNAGRFGLIQGWVPILLIFIKGRLGVISFYVSCFGMLMIVMPILSLTTRFGVSSFQRMDEVNLKEYFFRIPFIDVFDTLTYAVRYIDTHGFDYGVRTIGAIFFFIPRSIWPDKSQLLGLDVGGDLHIMGAAGTDNLSMFFAALFYADFGVMGVAVFSLLLCLIGAKFFGITTRLVNDVAMQQYVLFAAIPICVRGPIGAVASLVLMELVFLILYTNLLSKKQPIKR